METILLGNTDQKISRVGLGGCPLGGYGWGRCDDQLASEAVQRALDLGVNFFDTADVYGLGHSEELLSAALGTHRTEVVIASKFGVRWDASGRTRKDSSPGYMREALEASLRRLRVDCIPLYYVHWPDGVTPLAETVAALDRARQEGKIRWIGLSNHSAEALREALAILPVQAVQVQFSLVDQEPVKNLLPMAANEKTTLVTWGSLAQGLLTGKFDAETTFQDGDRRKRYENFLGEKLQANLKVVKVLRRVAERLGVTPAQVAIRWLLDTPGVGSVLFGAKRPEQTDDNVASTTWKLCDEDYLALENAAAAV